MVVGNEKIVNALMRVKSNLDSGVPQAIQYAAIEALLGEQDCIGQHNAIYQRRRDMVIKTLKKIGLEVKPPKASLYVWVKIPQGYTSIEYCTKMLDEASVVVTPGSGYGKYGEGYIRLSLTTPDERVKEGLARLEKWGASLKSKKKK